LNITLKDINDCKTPQDAIQIVYELYMKYFVERMFDWWDDYGYSIEAKYLETKLEHDDSLTLICLVQSIGDNKLNVLIFPIGNIATKRVIKDITSLTQKQMEAEFKRVAMEFEFEDLSY